MGRQRAIHGSALQHDGAAPRSTRGAGQPEPDGGLETNFLFLSMCKRRVHVDVEMTRQWANEGMDHNDIASLRLVTICTVTPADAISA